MPANPSILLAEDDERYRGRIAKNLALDGFTVGEACDGREALGMLQQSSYDLLVADIKMPRINGLELLHRIRAGKIPEVDPDFPVVMLTSVDSVEVAVEAIKSGAADYITKDSGRKEIIVRLRKALETRHLARENVLLRETLEQTSEFQAIIGESSAIQKVRDEITEIAPSDASALIMGETGTGKELVARAIHRACPRHAGPFVEINCAALPTENMFLSEVFGHEKAAFTGAEERKIGRFELAQSGTLLLDEIGDLTPESQAKLLRVIETRQFTRIGGTEVHRADVRFLFSTNKNLDQEVAEGRFRRDLFYRINVMPIHLPPLRERREDIPLIARYYLRHFTQKYLKPARDLSDKALHILMKNDWPGNVRELKNVVERLSIRAKGELATAADIDALGLSSAATVSPGVPLVNLPEAGIPLEEIEKAVLKEALARCNWVQKDAAEFLAISPDRMGNRVKKYGLTHPSWRKHKD